MTSETRTGSGARVKLPPKKVSMSTATVATADVAVANTEPIDSTASGKFITGVVDVYHLLMLIRLLILQNRFKILNGSRRNRNNLC